MTTNKRSFWQRFKKSIIGFSFLIILMVALSAWLGFKKVPHYLRQLWGFAANGSFRNIENDPTYGEDNAIADEASAAPAEPVDTIYWNRQQKNGGYIPDGVKQQLAAVKKIDFSKLRRAPDSPSSPEAQAALVRRLGPGLINLLKQHNAQINIGQCYTATPDASAKNKELIRVTAMVCAFNAQNKNLGNISQPLGIVYDFVKYEADPNTWYAADFSQTIPYDYLLNKKY